jgi:hypothetical protein
MVGIDDNNLLTFNPNLRQKFSMKKALTPLLAISLVALAIVPCARAQDSSADSDAVKTKLKQMEDAWAKASMDKDHGVAAVTDILADDYAGINFEGKHQNKSQVLDGMKNETETPSSSMIDNMNVHVYSPNLATVCGTSTEKFKDKNGKGFSRSYAWVDTFMERNGKWECIAEAETKLPDKK